MKLAIIALTGSELLKVCRSADPPFEMTWKSGKPVSHWTACQLWVPDENQPPDLSFSYWMAKSLPSAEPEAGVDPATSGLAAASRGAGQGNARQGEVRQPRGRQIETG